MKHMVDLANGKVVTVGRYVEAWKRVIHLPPNASIADGPGAWWPQSAQDVLRSFRQGLHQRINRHIPGYGQGRKWDPTWQSQTRAAAWQLNNNCAIHWLPFHLRERFKHRFSEAF